MKSRVPLITLILTVLLLASQWVYAANATRTMPVDAEYLLVPIDNLEQAESSAKTVRLRITVDGILVHNVDVTPAHTPDEIDWWGYLSLDGYRGKDVTIELQKQNDEQKLPEASQALAMLEIADQPRHLLPLKDEATRPQLHFSQMHGWNNDPNGMVYYDGEYHLFWQCNPLGLHWANMYWGHAVSPDMIHWQELPRVLRPHGEGVDLDKRHPSMTVGKCFSGSANIDTNNTAGWQTGDEKTIVAAFTDTGVGEAIAYSNDRGRTFTYWKGNPAIKHQGRDPKLIWYAPGKHWVIALYDEFENKQYVAFYTSEDLKTWTFQSRIEGYYECPEFFELPIDGDKNNTRWVLFAADAKYTIGTFDGKTFTPDDNQGKHQVHWGAFYASQCFSNPPDGRVVQIGWATIKMGLKMPFNQTFTLPTNLTLRTTPEGVRMFVTPIEEVDALRGKTLANKTELSLTPDAPATFDVDGQQFDILVELIPGDASKVLLQFGTTTVTYDVAKAELNEMPLKPVDGKVSFRVIVDRPMCEIVGNGGAVYQTLAREDAGQPIQSITLRAEGGAATLRNLEIFEMNSIWKK